MQGFKTIKFLFRNEPKRTLVKSLSQISENYKNPLFKCFWFSDYGFQFNETRSLYSCINNIDIWHPVSGKHLIVALVENARNH